MKSKKTLESSNIFSNIEVGMNLDIDFSKTETAQKNYTLPDGQIYMGQKGADHFIADGEHVIPQGASYDDIITILTQK